MILGSIMPWATVTTVFGQISVNGTDGDGQLTIVGGIAIVVLVLFSKYLASLIVSAITAAILVYDYIDVSSSIDAEADEFANASVGWGLHLAAAAAILAVVTSFMMVRRQKATDSTVAADPTI